MNRSSLYCLVLVLTLSSCARVVVKKAELGDEGLRFYRPHPYLLVTATKDAANIERLEITPLWLPNTSEEYVVRMSPGFGSAAMTPTLTDGWNLISLTATADSKVSETITALASLVTARGSLKPKEGQAIAKTIAPGIWKLEFDKEGTVSGIKQVLLF